MNDSDYLKGDYCKAGTDIDGLLIPKCTINSDIYCGDVLRFADENCAYKATEKKGKKE